MWLVIALLHTLVQFQFCVSQFQTLSDHLSQLYSSLFDADPSTLHHISLYPNIHAIYMCVPLPVATIDEVSVYYVIRYYTVSVQIYCH